MAEEKDLSQLVKEFLAELMAYLRQSGAELVSHILVDPLRKLAGKAALLAVATTLLISGAIFLAQFMVLGFAWLFGGNLVWGYLAAAVLVIALAVILLVLVGRSGRQEGGKRGKGRDQ